MLARYGAVARASILSPSGGLFPLPHGPVSARSPIWRKRVPRKSRLESNTENEACSKELSFEERITSRFLTWVAGLAGSDASAPSSSTGELVRRMEREAVAFLQLNDPNGLYADSRIEVD